MISKIINRYIILNDKSFSIIQIVFHMNLVMSMLYNQFNLYKVSDIDGLMVKVNNI